VKVHQIASGSASVSITEAELVLLNNALNEALHGLEMSEFDTRVGGSRETVRELQHQIYLLLSKIK
jgi:hypothetical protein